MITVSIAGDGGSISIEVLGYENASASDDSDANWLISRIAVVAGPFSGQLSVALTTQDFAHFRRDLVEALRTLTGKAVFQTDEDSLRFQVEMGSRGTAKVSGIAQVIAGYRASLTFAFETDQSYLTQARSALDAVVENFPVQRR